MFSANKLSKIFKNIKHSFFLCKGEIAALVYTKQNNKIKTQASELYTVINQYRNTVTEAKLSTQYQIYTKEESHRDLANITAIYTLFQDMGWI